MKFENTKVFNFDGALRGMRNPLQSWDKSDSWMAGDQFHIGENDMKLAQRLIQGGSPHRKFLRQIMVSVDITAPEYFYSQLDTYKVGTVANSTSKMHKLATTPIKMECFELDDYDPNIVDVSGFIELLEDMRQAYIKTKNPKIWKELIRWLPEGWLQTRTITMNYEVLRQMVYWREGHKLSEWRQFIDWVHTLPYAEELIFLEEKTSKDI